MITLRDVNLCAVPHLLEAELEDIYDKDLYREAFLTEFGVDPKKKPLGKKKQKWSSVIERLFREAGKPWNDQIKAQVKLWLAEFAAANSESIVKEPLSGPINSFVQTVEERLPEK